MDIITIGYLLKKIQTAASGIVDIKKENGYIVFVMADGTEFRIEDATKDIIDLDINGQNYIVVTYEDGTTTTSDHPLPNAVVMTGATSSTDGTSGYVPVPTSGKVKILNSRGEWDSTLPDAVASLSSVVPTTEIPEGATLTSEGWSLTDDEEIAEEFAKWGI